MKLPSIYDTSAALHSSSPALTSCDSSDPGDGPEFIRSCLNKQFAVTITDGRVVVGDFVCTDRDANIILGGTQEYVPGKPGNFKVDILRKTQIIIKLNCS